MTGELMIRQYIRVTSFLIDKLRWFASMAITSYMRMAGRDGRRPEDTGVNVAEILSEKRTQRCSRRQ